MPKDYVVAHNAERAECYSGSLVTWNETAAATPRSGRRTACCGTLGRHHIGRESIAMGWGNLSGADDAVKMWVGGYHHDTNTCSGASGGHYTQMVWKDSVRIGYARVVCNNGQTVFVTCNYDPRGNWIGNSPY